MEVEIVRQKRKTMVLKVIDENHAVLKAPYSLAEKEIWNFVESKKKWLRSIAENMQKQQDFSNRFDIEKFIYQNGEQVGRVEDLILSAEGVNSDRRLALIKKYYLQMFGNLKNRALELSNMSGLQFKEVKPLSSVCVWGSYNSKGQMKLNWKLLLVPQHLIDYVICHELCHSIHMNHKPMFWAALEKICPHCKSKRKELSQYDFLLKMPF